MSTIIQGYQLRTLREGSLVVKGPAVVPNAAETNLFTISGGNVLVTSLIGVVTTVFTATATTLTMGPKPTVGATVAGGIHNLTVLTSAALGAYVMPAFTAGVGGVGTVVGSIGVFPAGVFPFVVPAGTIEYEASAANTGQITWYLTYVPLDSNGAVS